MDAFINNLLLKTKTDRPTRKTISTKSAILLMGHRSGHSQNEINNKTISFSEKIHAVIDHTLNCIKKKERIRFLFEIPKQPPLRTAHWISPLVCSPIGHQAGTVAVTTPVEYQEKTSKEDGRVDFRSPTVIQSWNNSSRVSLPCGVQQRIFDVLQPENGACPGRTHVRA
jgi:hypothetical protein